jgi:CRP-like cAMP-binding protein
LRLGSEERARNDDWADVLATFPLFAGVRKRHLRRLVRGARFAEYAGGEIVLSSGPTEDALYLILSGTAKTINGSAPRTLSVGDYFGELSLIGAPRSNQIVVSTQPLHVMRLPRRSVVILARLHPHVTRTLLRNLLHHTTRSDGVVALQPR